MDTLTFSWNVISMVVGLVVLVAVLRFIWPYIVRYILGPIEAKEVDPGMPPRTLYLRTRQDIDRAITKCSRGGRVANQTYLDLDTLSGELTRLIVGTARKMARMQDELDALRALELELHKNDVDMATVLRLAAKSPHTLTLATPLTLHQLSIIAAAASGVLEVWLPQYGMILDRMAHDVAILKRRMSALSAAQTAAQGGKIYLKAQAQFTVAQEAIAGLQSSSTYALGEGGNDG